MDRKEATRLDRVWMFFAPIFVGLLALDQVTKWWAVNHVAPEANVDFGFSLVYNRVLLFNISLPQWAIYILTFCILALGVYLVLKNKMWEQKIHLVGFALILAGAIGNLIDRLHYGAVVDFIKVYWWPNFNLADVFIVSAVVILAWDILFHENALDDL
jgi:lipoprotein signal peptidase